MARRARRQSKQRHNRGIYTDRHKEVVSYREYNVDVKPYTSLDLGESPLKVSVWRVMLAGFLAEKVGPPGAMPGGETGARLSGGAKLA